MFGFPLIKLAKKLKDRISRKRRATSRFPLIKLAKKLKEYEFDGIKGNLEEMFPLIKLAKKLKAGKTMLTLPELLEFPLIKLAKKLKVLCIQFFCLFPEKVSIN